MNAPVVFNADTLSLTTYQYSYQSFPGTPQMAITDPVAAIEALPKCQDCQIKEVKPGEDACWDCLGEEQEPEFTFYSMGANGNWSQAQVSILSNGIWTPIASHVVSNTLTFHTPVTLKQGETLTISWKGTTHFVNNEFSSVTYAGITVA